MIPEGEAHVWLARPAPSGVGPWALIDETERRRALRFHRPGDLRAYVLAHALVRSALSSCAPAVAPARWRFNTGSHGRPEVAGPPTGLPLRFNLSHADGLVGCVVATADCGLDVERAHARTDVRILASSCLTGLEQRALALAAPEARPEVFVRFWTLKEAYAKALGLGLSLPFDRVGFVLTPRPQLVEGEGDWQVEQWSPSPEHVVAVALRRDGAPPWRLAIHEGLPEEPALPAVRSG